MIETRPQKALAEGGVLGMHEAVQHLSPAAVGDRGYNSRRK